MNDVPVPTLDMWIFAGAGLGAFVTWMTMHMLGRNAYQHGFDHGRIEAEHDWMERYQASERERERLTAALARAIANLDASDARPPRLAGDPAGADPAGTRALLGPPPPAATDSSRRQEP